MSDQDVDDVAFLTGTHYTTQITHSICQSSSLVYNACDLGGVTGTESPAGPTKKSLYENNGVAACSQKRALCIATVVFAIFFTASVIIAYTGPQSECTCAGNKPPNYVDDEWNETKMLVPRATNGQIFPWNNIRLPTFITPTRYNITMHPNLTTLEVKGQVSIEFQVEKDTNFLVLHSKNLTITDKIVQDKKGHPIRISRLLEYLEGQQIYIEIKEKFRKKHNYTLNIRYTTKLNRDFEGFYISSYINNGERRYLATTHFEPTHARSAFPCFDEPHFKARFKMSIFRDRFHIALFNMPVINTEDVGFYMGTGLLRDDFQESVEMSTYLVAFVICDYVHQNKQTERGISVSVYAPPPYISQASFALETAVNVMDYFEDFFRVAYPLPKQDLIAIPDFVSGAMENWGLITYRETSILYDPNETSTSAHQWVAIVVAHELAHQWFGNLVTMRWWNDLWLNEGFASFLEYVGVDNLKPEWNMMDQFILDKTQPALALDALASSHPISVAIQDPSEIEAIFDTISYSKGAAILHMLAKFLQLDTLQNGLNEYLTTFKYSNADTKDLWNVFSKHTNQSLEVKVIMDTWTNQMGFPLVTLVREEDEILATQDRFLLTTESVNSSVRSMPKSKFDYKWFVPLTYFTSKYPEEVHTVWMNMSDVRIEVDSDVKWIKANINQSGFYRVMYDETMWTNIIADLRSNHTIFNPADRASLIDDAFTLSRAGLLNASIPLDLSLYLIKEKDYVPWATAIKHFQAWSRRLSESLAYKLFLKYMRKLLTPVTKLVGWGSQGSHLERLLRTDVLSTAILCELNETVFQAKSQFEKWMHRNQSIPADLKEVVYSAGVKYGGLGEWQHCWNVYNSTIVPSERKLFLKALGVASDPWLLQRYLLETLHPNRIKPQDVKIVLTVVAANPEGRLLAWRHLKAYWPNMQSLFGNATFMMGSLISAVTAHLSTPYDYYEVSTYFNGMNVGSATRALEQSLETIKLNINWVSQNEEDIYTWLLNYLK
ncbi:endoplasmic reticulum aminopeptidase 1-like isoform X2 [Photinus pyralis]|uniref:endoplasmic reticulum aminopeptidase 1-like isoform X2 n=1 Tax=Photinus pyralis TaxID=7054 RepID=UPI001267596E|nr:endoplasmic reticulum aminopeptidase 1-like isoform X2 [Photinus pyralis]XP_031336696.1 endoplasmic reticulum aminopeptidase 1-like isoform X2 [Photinus pyralis]